MMNRRRSSSNSSNNNNCSGGSGTRDIVAAATVAVDDNKWIEVCLENGIPMRRSFFVIVAGAPYLMHKRNLSYEQAFSSLQLFLWKSERLKPLNNPHIDHYEALIRYALARTQYYQHLKPISFRRLKYKEPILYQYLMQRKQIPY